MLVRVLESGERNRHLIARAAGIVPVARTDPAWQSCKGLEASMSVPGSLIVSGRCSMVTSESFRINIDILHVSRRH
jgi:hypothetical protein